MRTGPYTAVQQSEPVRTGGSPHRAHEGFTAHSVPFGLHPFRTRQAQPKLIGWCMTTHDVGMSTTPDDCSGLQSSLPAQPIRCSAISALECLTSLADDMTCRVGGGALVCWPPSAAQTARTVFPYAAFTKIPNTGMPMKELIEPDLQAHTVHIASRRAVTSRLGNAIA